MKDMLKNKENQITIGVFDSGFGGLTVLNELVSQMPQLNYLYLGDNNRAPYGVRSKQDLDRIGDQLIRFLLGKGVNALVIACNTITTCSLDNLIERYPEVPMVGTIAPAIKELDRVLRSLPDKSSSASVPTALGLIATPATIKSGAFQAALKKNFPSLRLHFLATPALAPLVESGKIGSDFAQKIVDEELAVLKKERLDLLLLACTHYPLISKEIHQALGNNLQLINPAKSILPALEEGLHFDASGLDKSSQGKITIYTTGLVDAYHDLLAKGQLPAIQNYTIEEISLPD